MPRRDPEARRAADRARDATPERRKAARQRMRAKRWREGALFRCAVCAGRFSRQREAWMLRDGKRVRLGTCAFCADTLRQAAQSAQAA
jgi:hypothetical protein